MNKKKNYSLKEINDFLSDLKSEIGCDYITIYLTSRDTPLLGIEAFWNYGNRVYIREFPEINIKNIIENELHINLFIQEAKQGYTKFLENSRKGNKP